MNEAILLGFGVGAGCLLLLSGLIPARHPLAVALARLHRPRVGRAEQRSDTLLIRILGRPLAKTAIAARPDSAFEHPRPSRHRPDRRGELFAKQGLCALTGLVWAPATVGLMRLGGVSLSLLLPLWGSLAFSVAGFFVPLLGLKVTAAERRRGFRHAFSCFLDLVAVRLAGGAGIESALSMSAQHGQGWAFARDPPSARRGATHGRAALDGP